MRMDERNRGGVVKNRSSSGCLIIKKKLDGVSGEMVGSSLGGRKSKKEKKRPRLTTSDDELMEFHGRRGGSGVSQGSSAPVVYKRGVGNHGEFSSRINDYDDIGFGRSELMREVGGIKRSKLDIYDFDEYDDLSDVEGIGMRRFYERETGGSEKRFVSSAPGMKSSNGLKFDNGSSKGDIIYKRRNSFRGSATSEKIKGSDHRSSKQRFEVKPEHPTSMGKEKVGGSGDEAIRLQGRNGVLKVMVKNKEIKGNLKPQNEGNNIIHRSQEVTTKNVFVHHPSYSERKVQKRPMGIGRVDEDRQKKRKALSVKSSEESDEESEDSDTSPKLQSESMEAHRSMKRGRNGGTIRSPEKSQPTELKEGKVKRGNGTEKQLLREKIRNMLVNAGWTIDYRPRRGRDYFDAVYVNPSGTAYWSIIKAYDALQKQLEEEGKSLKAAEDSSCFAPISEDILSKLTRQTKKKMEKELKRKKREEVRGKRKKELSGGNFEEDDDSDTDTTGSGRRDDKLSSFMKRSGKSFKGASKEAYANPNGKMSEMGERSSSMSNARFIHGRKSKKIGRCTLLIRSAEKGLESESDGYVPYTGKRNLLSWLIDSGAVKLSEKVHYMNRRRTRIMLEGWITRDGIHCGCCSKILTVSKFEIHAASKLRQPFLNIYSSSGLSLLQCQVEAWNRQEESLCNGFHKIDVDGDDPNDDTCAICGDGGNLICCDGCPSTFHQNCLDIQMLPPGDWHCPHCSCKFCGLAGMSGDEVNDKTKDTVLTCGLCEGKYHSACVEELDDTPVNSNSSVSFCGKKCQEVFERLQKLLGVKHELEAGLYWSLIRRTTLDSDTSARGYPQRVEWNSKLAVALTLMDECFLPITDRRSGINLIHNVLYNCGSNFTRLNYSGFYTAVLERGDEIICAASIRIRGTQFAEMPFIGTRHIYRRQGMCRRLFSAIESALRSLKVEKLIIPAISELMETWTTVFGFSALGDSDKQEMKTLNMMAFPGTDMLQKKLLQGQSSAKKNLAGVNSLKVGQHTSMVPGLTNKPDPDAGPSSASAWPDNDNVDEKSIADICSQDQVGSIDGTYPAGGVFNEAKTSLRSASAAISNEMNPLVLNEGSQGVTSSALLFDMKLNACAAAADETLHGSPDAADEIQEIGKYLNDSPVKHDMDESEEHNMTQEAGNGEADVALPLADGPMPGTSDSALLDNSLGNDKHARNDETLCYKKEPIADVEPHNLSEATHNDDITTEKPMIEYLAEGNNAQHSLEDEVDDAHEVPAVVVDVSSSSHSLHVSVTNDLGATHEQTVEVSESEVDGMVESLKDASHKDVSHGPVEIQDHQPDSLHEDTNHPILEDKVDHAGIEAPSFLPDSNVSCENPARNGGTPPGSENPELDSCEISTENPGNIDLVKPQLDSSGANNIPILDGESHHQHDNGVGAVNNSSFEASAQNDETSSHSAENPPSLSSDGGTRDTILPSVTYIGNQSTT